MDLVDTRVNFYLGRIQIVVLNKFLASLLAWVEDFKVINGKNGGGGKWHHIPQILTVPKLKQIEEGSELCENYVRIIPHTLLSLHE